MLLSRRLPVYTLGAIAVSAAVVLPRGAGAQGSFEGTWTAGTTTMDVAVESWGADCGPRPVSSSSQGGGSVRISQQGDSLTIHARGRDVPTGSCWSRNPIMRVERSRADSADGMWETLCRTPPDDPREEVGTYTIKAQGDNRLLYRDVSRYNWRLKDSTCVATITTTQTLLRNEDAPLQPLEGEPAKPERPGCTAGPPARLILRPGEAELELGQRVCFRARVLDAEGCAIEDAAVDWSLQHSKAVRATLNGNCLVAGDNAAEAEGEFRVLARHGKLRASAQVQVRAADLSSLLAKRLETGAITGFEPSLQDGGAAVDAGPHSGQASVDPPARVGARAVGQAPPEGGSLLLWAGGAAVLLLLSALLISMRRRGRTLETAQNVESTGHQQPATASTAVSDGAAPSGSPPAETWICPSCRQGFAQAGSCPKDGSVLVTYQAFVQQHRERTHATPKRCPRCGERYPNTSTFCGRDGSPLESAV